MADLSPVANAEADSDRRRTLAADEVRRLIAAAVAGPDLFGVAGADRALLYWFGFETGIRPGQMRSLTVGDFDLDADPPVVRTQAKYVKRRREHTQILPPGLAAELRRRFKNKLPAAAAFTMPRKYDLAEMLRGDWPRPARRGSRRPPTTRSGSGASGRTSSPT